jgi:flagellar biosynthetic protein FlhB
MLVENPAVAQILWKTTEIGEEIPVELYQAVAEILALVYRLRDQKGVDRDSGL